MKQAVKIHIVFKTLALLLGLLLLIPTATKFAHIFAHHKHDVCICKDKKTPHLHELNIDCDFYKFNIHHHYTFDVFEYHIFTPKAQSPAIASQYHFLSDFQRLQTALRGPPAFI